MTRRTPRASEVSLALAWCTWVGLGLGLGLGFGLGFVVGLGLGSGLAWCTKGSAARLRGRAGSLWREKSSAVLNPSWLGLGLGWVWDGVGFGFGFGLGLGLGLTCVMEEGQIAARIRPARGGRSERHGLSRAVARAGLRHMGLGIGSPPRPRYAMQGARQT